LYERSEAVMVELTEPPRPAPTRRRPDRLARVAGALYLPVFVLGAFALVVVPAVIVVPDDAAATAGRLADHGWVLRLGSVTEVYLALTDVVLAALFYLLFRPASRPLALVSSLLRLSWAVVTIVAVLTNLAALHAVSDDAGYLGAFTTDQRQAAALALLEAHRLLVAAGFVAFGCHLAVLGVLIRRSGILPRLVGTLLVVAGVGYVANSLVVMGGGSTQPLLLLPAFPAELSLCLWLLLRGTRDPART
jgi:hypothetical protein